jgi:MinD-like ATPase involved in chromosome partitioning or flagellar assembly
LEPRSLKGFEPEQGGELEQAHDTAAPHEVRLQSAVAGGEPGVGAAAEGLGSDAPQQAMSRQDVYAQPMRAGKPLPRGPLTRLSSWLKYTLSSDLRRREWSVDEQLAHAPSMSRPNTVAVISPKGGVGKTTISFVLGNLLADKLRLRVVALDANPDFGTLSSLAPDDYHSTRSLADLLADSAEIESPAELSPYVARLSTGLHLLGGPAHAEVMAQMTPGLYSRLLEFLERFYEVVILDLGTGVTDPLAQFAVDRADQTVVITTPEWVTAAGVLGALRYLQLEQGTLVLNQAPTGRHAGNNRDVIEANFRRHAVETSATIPYDEQLRVMLDTGTYSLSALKLGMRVPVKELGAAIAYRFV